MKKVHPVKSIAILSAVLFIVLSSSYQSLAQLQFPEKTELYRDDVVPRIDILIDEVSLDFIFSQENWESNQLHPATFIFDNGTVNDTLENVGFRLRGNTSRSARKKSFKIDINGLVPGRRYSGVQKINLNGQHNDPTSSRSKICADLADRMQIPSLRSNHVELYINGAYYGLYTNVEHIDQNYAKKRFGNKNGNLYKCLYPADLDYKGDNPNVYKEVIFGRRAYDLKNNEHEEDYSDLANFIRVLNLTSDANLACELEKVFNVDLYLKFIIFDILTGNWDGPIWNKNNFYLYHNEATDQFEYIPYDVDNTLGIDWVNRDWANRNIYEWSKSDEPRPLFNRLMENQEYRDRFSYYMQETLLNIYNEAELYPYLDNLRDKLKPYIENDTYYTLDYGFDVDDFEDGFEFKLGYFQTDYGIKTFIQERLIAAFTQLESNDISPVITDRINNHPNESEETIITAKVIDDMSVEEVEVCYTVNNGNETCITMTDDGNQNDGEANDGIYGAIIPATFETGELNYDIRAVDNTGKMSLSPKCGKATIILEEEELKLAINEFMASNNITVQDEEGEYDDWIEIYNYGSNPIYLGDKFLSDNEDNPDKWNMPPYYIQGGEYLIFWADDDRNQGSYHTNFKLKKSGEHIGIYDDDNTENAPIDQLDYEEQTSDISRGRLPNGTGEFTFLEPTPGGPNLVTSAEEDTIDQFEVTPNPTSGRIEILTNQEDYTLKLFNSIGQEVKYIKVDGTSINLPDTPGLYYLNIFIDQKPTQSIKIIKI